MRVKLTDLESASFKHAQKVSETLEQELSRFEKVLSAFEKHIEETSDDLKKLVNVSSNTDGKWRESMETQTNQKFTEVHNALKLLNNNIEKTGTDSVDRFELCQKDLKTSENGLQAQIADLAAKISLEDSALHEQVQLVVERVNEKLDTKIEKSVVDMKREIAEM